VRTAPIWRPKDRNRRNLTVWTLVGRPGRVCGTSLATSIPRPGQTRAVGTPIPDHYVSGPRLADRGVQLITAIIPVCQCGHARKDCPVNVSNRSR
jgi:hypothetical protein